MSGTSPFLPGGALCPPTHLSEQLLSVLDMSVHCLIYGKGCLIFMLSFKFIWNTCEASFRKCCWMTSSPHATPPPPLLSGNLLLCWDSILVSCSNLHSSSLLAEVLHLHHGSGILSSWFGIGQCGIQLMRLGCSKLLTFFYPPNSIVTWEQERGTFLSSFWQHLSQYLVHHKYALNNWAKCMEMLYRNCSPIHM